jgi:hypothetical protein
VATGSSPLVRKHRVWEARIPVPAERPDQPEAALGLEWPVHTDFAPIRTNRGETTENLKTGLYLRRLICYSRWSSLATRDQAGVPGQAAHRRFFMGRPREENSASRGGGRFVRRPRHESSARTRQVASWTQRGSVGLVWSPESDRLMKKDRSSRPVRADCRWPANECLVQVNQSYLERSVPRIDSACPVCPEGISSGWRETASFLASTVPFRTRVQRLSWTNSREQRDRARPRP